MNAALLLALASSAASWAHSPHDVAAWVAFSPGEQPRWVITSLVRYDSWLLVRTQDLQTIELRYLGPESEEITSAAMAAEERLLLGMGRQGLRISEDAGDSFDDHPDIPQDATVNQLAVSPGVLDDGLALCAGKDGDGAIWRSEDAGLHWELVASLPGLELLDLSLSPDWEDDGRAVAMAREGQLLVSQDRGLSWQQTGTLDEEPWQVAAGPQQRVWAATPSEGLLRSDDDGESWQLAAFGEQAVTTVAELAGELVLATLPADGIWLSDDGGGSWSLQDQGVQPCGTGVGNPTDGNHFFEIRQAGDGAIWYAAWEGIAYSLDVGQSWQPVETYRPDALHGAAISLDEQGEPSVLLTSNGGALQWVHPGQRQAAATGYALPRPWPREIAVSPRWNEAASLLTTLSDGLAGSSNRGGSWSYRAAEAGLGGAQDVSLATDELGSLFALAAGLVQGQPGYCVSMDAGVAWHCDTVPAEDWSGVCEATAVSPSFQQDGMAWLACNGHVLASEDMGLTWRELFTLGSEVSQLAGAPGGQPLLLASHEGLWRSDGGAQPELLAFEGARVWDVALSPQWNELPMAFALVAGQGWQRSADGGESWELLEAPSLDVPVRVALSPSFSQDGSLAVATFTGAHFSRDQGETWENIHALETIDTWHPYWTLEGQWQDVALEGALRQGYVQADSSGASARFAFRGVAVELAAVTLEDGGQLGLQLDGQDMGSVSLEGEDDVVTRIWSSQDLEDGWHELELVAERGPVTVDGAVVWRLDYAEVPVPAPDPGARCGGCGGGGGSLPWWLAVWATVLVGRRARGCPTTPRQAHERTRRPRPCSPDPPHIP